MSDYNTNFVNADSQPKKFNELTKALKLIREGELSFASIIPTGSADLLSTIENITELPSSIKDAVNNIAGTIQLDNISEALTGSDDFGLGALLESADISLSDKNFLTDNFNSFLSTVDQGIQDVFSTGTAFLSSITDNALQSLSNALYMPTEIFLAEIKVLYDVLKSNPNYRNNFLRNLCLRKDLLEVVEWLDYINKTSYTFSSGRFKDAITSSKNGAFKTALYILNIMKKDRDKLIEANTDETNNEIIDRYKEFFCKVIKNIIVFSYSNLTEGKLQTILTDYDIDPSVFGTSDTEFGNKFTITISDLNNMCPLSSYQSSIIPKRNRTIIDPRNNNIKKIYIMLVNRRLWLTNDRIMYNQDFYQRLHYPINSFLEDATRSATETFKNSRTGLLIQDIVSKEGSLIYELAKRVENILFDPKKQKLLPFEDRDQVPPLPKLPTPPRQELKVPGSNPSIIPNETIDYDSFNIERFNQENNSDLEIMKTLINLFKHSRVSYVYQINIAMSNNAIEYTYIFSNKPFPTNNTVNFIKSILIYDIVFKSQREIYDTGVASLNPDSTEQEITDAKDSIKTNITNMYPSGTDTNVLYHLTDSEIEEFIGFLFNFDSPTDTPATATTTETTSKLDSNTMDNREKTIRDRYGNGDFHIDDQRLLDSVLNTLTVPVIKTEYRINL